MRNLLLLALISCLLAGCLRDIVLGDEGKSTAHQVPPRKSMVDPYTGEEIKIWIPKTGMIMSKVWESFARAEEERCSNGYYRGKNDIKLLPSQRGVYKKLSHGGWVWAYYYYYGEDIPGFNTTNWHETIFNIYTKNDGTIYGCVYKKYKLGQSDKYRTLDGIDPRVYPPH